jgi:hypothetical protein
LTVTGRQKIAAKWRPEIVKIGQHMLRGKPADIRAVLESKIVQDIDGEELGKFFRFALESAKIDAHLSGTTARTIKVVSEKVDKELRDEAVKALGIERDYLPIVDNNNRQVGVISYKSFGKDVKIEAIYVRDKRKGFASEAINEVIGNKSSYAFVEPSNKSLMLMFENLGFKVQSSRKIDGVTYNVVYRSAIKDSYSKENLLKLNSYRTALALEQDASSSGAQIIALTTRNKQLAELSNVIPTTQKKRLYDEIAAAAFHDPRFKELNKKFGLTEKDLRKAAKAQNMVEELPCINTVNSGKPQAGNPEPSLRGNFKEGATTRTYHLEQMMKSVETMPSRSAVT